MKQALIVIVSAMALVAWVFLWFRNEGAVATSAARSWPGGMGSLDAVVNRWPSLKASNASVKLTALAKALPKNEAVDDFVEREIVRGELTIGDPPNVLQKQQQALQMMSNISKLMHDTSMAIIRKIGG